MGFYLKRKEPAKEASVSKQLPCTSKHELMALLDSGWRLTLDGRDWVLRSEKGTSIKVYADQVLEVPEIVNRSNQ